MKHVAATVESSGSALVLIVDDDARNCELLTDLLMIQGYRCLSVADGLAALKMVTDTPPDVILLDIMMPKMDGFEVCRRLKQDPAHAFIPVLMVTALSERDHRLRGIEVGANDFIVKPIDPDEVAMRVRNAVQMKRLHDQVKLELKQVRELEALRDSLIHFVAHDQRSVLMGLSCGLQIIMAQNQGVGDSRRFLEMAVGATHELTEMVNSMLDLSRIEANQMPVRREVCRIKDVAVEVVRRIMPIATYRSVSIDVQGTNPALNADRELLERVLANLCANAIKFTPTGKKVEVVTGELSGCVRVWVTDQGPGIPEEFLGRLFEKFSQVESRRENRKYSSGLGLAFCKMAVEIHGGRIGVESRIDMGSSFWFELPAI